MKYCPLTKEQCNKNCAWYREGDDECAISTLAYCVVGTYNEIMEEKELQENLFKADKKELSN